MRNKMALVAIGGNSLIVDKNHPEVANQWDAVRETCRHLANMVEAGWQLIITHGNGPQVGFILRRNELAAGTVHTTPLDLVVSDTQGSIGYMLQQALRNELYERGIRKSVVSVVTQVLVDEHDPAFQTPTKPIGSFMTDAEARQFEAQGWRVMEDAGRGWRRMVASPKPLQVIEETAVRDLLHAGHIVVAAGGGGIPVKANARGELRDLKGVYAVIDKDRASSLLAQSLDVDLFMISTGVEFVSLNFNTPQQQDLREITAAQLAQHMQAGHFAPGSMRPKIEAVLDFVQSRGGGMDSGGGGKTAVITNPPNLAKALNKQSGTWVIG